jgi:hypothetical protein
MGILADRLSPSDKQAYIEKKLIPGVVVYLFRDDIDPPHDKYLILARPGNKVLLFCINSNICSFIANRKALLECQVQLNASDYDFLSHDSFANCGEVVVMAKSKIVVALMSDMSRIRGELNDATRKEIVRVVKQSKTISRLYGQQIIDALSSK